MKPFLFSNKLGRILLSWIQHMIIKVLGMSFVTNPNDKTYLLLKLYFKCTDAYYNCSFGTNLNSGTYFVTPPHLFHGPNGIMVDMM